MYQLIDKNGKISSSDAKVIVIDKNGKVKQIVSGGTGSAVWGSITGTLTSQTDLISYLTTNYYPLSTNPAGYLTSSSLTGYVPNTITLTINGTTFDLTSNRTWSVGDLLSSGSYANPSWLTSLAYSKLTGAPTIPTVGTWGALNYPTWTTGTPFVKMTAAGTFALDTNTYLTGITGSQVTTALGFTPYNSTNPSSFIPLTALSSTATGLTYTNTTGVFSLTSGYLIPTTSSYNNTNWDTAYIDRNKWDGGSIGLVAATGRTSLGATTVGSNLFTLTNPSAITFLRINTDNTVSTLDASTFRGAIGAGTLSSAIISLSGQTGATQIFGIGTSGTNFNISSASDVHTFNIPISSSINTGLLGNSDWTNFNNKQSALVSGSNIKTVNSNSILGSGDLSVGTVTSVSAITLGTSGTDLTSSVANGTTTPTITLNVPTASATNRGVLSSTDWTTFNNKQPLLGYTPYRYINTTQQTVTGTTTETIVASTLISGGTFNVNDVMKMLYKVTKTGAVTSNINLKIRINTGNTLTGAVTIASLTLANTLTYSLMSRTFDLSGGNLYGYSFTGSVSSDITTGTISNSTTYNTANTLYVFFTIQLTTSSDSCTFNMANITN